MAFHQYRVSREIILQIVEYCDLETLSSITQTCKDLHSLINNYEHSISLVKIAATYQPPKNLVLNSKTEECFAILDRNTFTTVRELERRERRIESLLNRSGFLLTLDPKILGMTSAALDRFKAGLRDGIYLADELADVAAQHILPKPSSTKQPPSRTNPSTNPLTRNAPTTIAATTTTTTTTTNFPTRTQRHAAQLAIWRSQVAHLRSRSWRALAWLVTLAAGGGKGYARYSARLLENDPALAGARIMAFKEVLLRHGGSLVLWGFMRGRGTLGAFVRHAVSRCAEEVLFFEEGGVHVLGADHDEDDGAESHGKDDDEGEEEGEEAVGVEEQLPDGLHMCIMAELHRRLEEGKRAEAAEQGRVWDGDVGTREVWETIHTLVGKEIGCETWGGYGAITYPV